MAIGDRIPMDSKHIHVEGNDTLVSGSALVQRDLSREFNWWKLRPVREIMPPPTGMKWCSGHDQAVNGGWVDRERFTKDSRYRDGKYPICNDCKARHARMLRALEREAQGQQVRPYRRQTTIAKA